MNRSESNILTRKDNSTYMFSTTSKYMIYDFNAENFAQIYHHSSKT